jgi:hypothetical protein
MQLHARWRCQLLIPEEMRTLSAEGHSPECRKGADVMTLQSQRAEGMVERRTNPGSEPLFYFDGDFRTWDQVQRRAQLNRAIAAHLARH